MHILVMGICIGIQDNKMYVFGAPAASTSTTDLQAAWAEVTSTGEFKELTLVDNGATSGPPTF